MRVELCYYQKYVKSVGVVKIIYYKKLNRLSFHKKKKGNFADNPTYNVYVYVGTTTTTTFLK